MEDNFANENRTFLHNIATPLSILKLLMKRIAAAQNGTGPASDVERMNEFIARALKSLESIEAIHAQFKSELSARESNVPKNTSAKKSA